MTGKPKLLTIILFFILCAGLLPLLAWPLPYEGLDWLALGQAIAAYGESTKPPDEPQPPDEVDPRQAREVHDPETPSITAFFPADAVSEPITVEAYLTPLPGGVTALPNTIGSPFFFGAWIRGQGRTVDRFETSIRLRVDYDEAQIPRFSAEQTSTFQISGGHQGSSKPLLFPLPKSWGGAELRISAPAATRGGQGQPVQASEEQLRLNMYDPASQTWIKLCSWVDVYADKVSGLLVMLTEFEPGGNTLFAISLDQTPPPDQVVDDRGRTTLTIPGANFSLEVLPGTVEPGTHFEFTLFPNIPDAGSVKLLSKPVDVKACRIDYANQENSRQLTEFPKPIQVELDYPPQVASTAGGAANLTGAIQEGEQWTNLELLGYQVIGSDNTISVEVDTLGTFSLVVR
jgi:hypothetical protein